MGDELSAIPRPDPTSAESGAEKLREQPAQVSIKF
jgi:hypothetical protein